MPLIEFCIQWFVHGCAQETEFTVVMTFTEAVPLEADLACAPSEW